MKGIFTGLGRRVFGRLHVPIGQHIITALLAFACIMFSIMVSCDAWAAELPAGHDAHWTIEDYVWNAAAATKFRLSNCTISTTEYSLKPGGVVRAAADLCGDGLSVIKAPDGAESAAHLIFDDGVTQSSYFVPALDRKKEFGPVAPITVDARYGTYLTVYSDQPQTLTWIVYGPDGAEAGRGDMAAAKGWSQYSIGTPVSAGSLRVVAGCPAFGICPAYPFLGFAAVTDIRGGNAIVVPLR